MSHSAIEAATRADLSGSAPIAVAVHPVARRAAAVRRGRRRAAGEVLDPLPRRLRRERGEPEPKSFDAVDADVQEFARRRVTLTTDAALGESEAVLSLAGEEVARVEASRGSPQRPMSLEQLAAKCHRLADDRLDGLLDDRDAPAQTLLDALA